MAVNTSNNVYGSTLSQALWPAPQYSYTSEGVPQDVLPQETVTAQKLSSWFDDPAAAQAIIDQVNSGALPQAEAVRQLGPLMNQEGFYSSVNDTFARGKKDKPWSFDSPLYGMALIAGAGALGGAFSGAAGAGGGAVPGTVAEDWAAAEMANLGGGTTGGATAGMGTVADDWAASQIGNVGGPDVIGSDWAAGNATGAPGGLANTGGAGANTAWTPPGGSVFSGDPTIGNVGPGAGNAGDGGILGKILNGGAGWGDFLKLLGPAMSVGSGAYGLDAAGNLGGPGSAVDVNTRDALAIGNSGKIDPNAVMTAGAGGNAESMQKAISAADPWGTSGGRALADRQLQALMQNPNDLLNDPGYKARMMGVERGMAAQGYTGSGNMAAAAANASGDFYNQRLALLGGLENMGNPVGAQQVGTGVGQLGVQQGTLNLNAQKAASDLALAKGDLGLRSAQLNLGAQMGANSLAGQALASIGFGATQATGGNTTIPAAIKDWFRSQGIVI